MSTDPLADLHCGYTVLGSDGIEQPCDRPATDWRWYQDCGHEDALEPACDWHANEGGRRIHDAARIHARLADEGTVEKVAGALLQRAALGIGALDDYSESDREFFRGDARAVLDVIAGLIGDGDR